MCRIEEQCKYSGKGQECLVCYYRGGHINNFVPSITNVEPKRERRCQGKQK